MKTLNEKFTDEEFKKLSRAKKKIDEKLNWHDFIMQLVKNGRN
jgi:hypothetical protein